MVKKTKYQKYQILILMIFTDYSDIIISIFINEPSFEGQTKKRIIMPKLQKQLRGYNSK